MDTKKQSKIFLYVQIIGCVLVLLAILTNLTGCLEDAQYGLSTKVDLLLNSDNCNWVYKDKTLTYNLSNGTVIVRFDGSISFLVNNTIIYVAGVNKDRAARIAIKCGIEKMTSEELINSSEIQEIILNHAIIEVEDLINKPVTNPISTNIVYEVEK